MLKSYENSCAIPNHPDWIKKLQTKELRFDSVFLKYVNTTAKMLQTSKYTLPPIPSLFLNKSSKNPIQETVKKFLVLETWWKLRNFLY